MPFFTSFQLFCLSSPSREREVEKSKHKRQENKKRHEKRLKKNLIIKRNDGKGDNCDRIT